MSRIFVNYRTGDGEMHATLVERELSRRFGSAEVFLAVKSIQPGQDFETAILRAVRRCDVLIAVIGPKWLTVEDTDGRPAVEHPTDWVRREIVEAFGHDVVVVPLLVDGADRLSQDRLPAELAELGRRQYLRFDRREVDAGIDRLAGHLATIVPGIEPPREPGIPPDRVTNNVVGSDARYANFGIINH